MIERTTMAAALPLLALLFVGCSSKDAGSPAWATEALSGKADFAGQPSAEMDWDAIQSRCTRAAENDPVIYSSDFHWEYTPDTMGQRFEEMYTSEKRLSGRAYFEGDEGVFVLPHIAAWGGDVTLSTRLIENIRRHIEKALLRGYAEYVFFPDMGHSHLFIPQAHWDDRYAGTPSEELSAMYSKLFDDPELLVLYHTAEQLEMLDEDGGLLDDRHIRWRFFTRNVVGDNAYLSRLELLHDPEHQANTARAMPGHRYQGIGFNISATGQGCFPYVHEGVNYWFDISLSDPLPDPSAGDIFL